MRNLLAGGIGLAADAVALVMLGLGYVFSAMLLGTGHSWVPFVEAELAALASWAVSTVARRMRVAPPHYEGALALLQGALMLAAAGLWLARRL
jgi:hypothetical protein